MHVFPVLRDKIEFGLMANGGVVPVGIRRVGLAVGFQVIDSYFSSRNPFIMNNEPVILAIQSDGFKMKS